MSAVEPIGVGSRIGLFERLSRRAESARREFSRERAETSSAEDVEEGVTFEGSEFQRAVRGRCDMEATYGGYRLRIDV